ncbi:MAG: hypothetical protein U5K77_01565 [Candidatus Saccharibacteria bacterium]|nr:hypothetical protein [Candidatus Saccharibacteria bacterium]
MARLPFRRTKQDQQPLPDEAQEYYQAQRREKTGMAWLLAVVTLLATLLIALGIFLGGRWAYRAVFDNDTTTETEMEQEVQDDGSVDNAPRSTDEPVRLPGDDVDESDDNDNDTDADQDDATQSESTPTTTPTTGPSALPSTGPSSNL